MSVKIEDIKVGDSVLVKGKWREVECIYTHLDSVWAKSTEIIKGKKGIFYTSYQINEIEGIR